MADWLLPYNKAKWCREKWTDTGDPVAPSPAVHVALNQLRGEGGERMPPMAPRKRAGEAKGLRCQCRSSGRPHPSFQLPQTAPPADQLPAALSQLRLLNKTGLPCSLHLLPASHVSHLTCLSPACIPRVAQLATLWGNCICSLVHSFIHSSLKG